MKRATWYANLPIALAHELCHYLAARLFQMPARLHSYHVTFDPEAAPTWQVVLVLLAPALVGVGAALALTVAAIALDKWLIIPAAFVAAGCWLLTCLSDIHNVMHFLRRGTWPDDLLQAPSAPQHLTDWLRERDQV